MQVKVNHDDHLRITGETAERLSRMVEDALAKYADRVTRVEMHLEDVNAGKHGNADKRCLIEARLAKLQPVAVTHHAESVQLAIDGALERLDRALEHAIGKQKAY
jgi:ribosome-associated translation inhibitor RaiA